MAMMHLPKLNKVYLRGWGIWKLQEISNQDRTAPRLRGCKNLLKEIESCHGWINPVIVGHVS